MSVAHKIKEAISSITKNASTSDDPRMSDSFVAGGRRKGESLNPYLTARRTWNEHLGSVVASRQGWQITGILGLLIGLAGVGGMIYIGSQSKFIPYIIQVDEVGRTVAAGPLQATTVVDPRVIRTSIINFIQNSRTVTPDAELQHHLLVSVYAFISTNDPAFVKINEYLSNEETNKTIRAGKEMVSVDVQTPMQQSTDTWLVEWVETVRSRQGEVREKKYMRALVTIRIVSPDARTTQEQMNSNPFGVYVSDFSWSNVI